MTTEISGSQWIAALMVAIALIGGSLIWAAQTKPLETVSAAGLVTVTGTAMSIRSSDQIFARSVAPVKPTPVKPTPVKPTKEREQIKKKPKVVAPKTKAKLRTQTQRKLSHDTKTKSARNVRSSRPTRPVTATPAQSTAARETPLASSASSISAKSQPATESTTVATVSPSKLPDTARREFEARMLQALARAKRYPAIAQRQNLQGIVTVQFALDENGNVVSRSVTQSSGELLLDQAALEMMDRAKPLPAPPSGYGEAPHFFTIPVEFELQ